MSLSNVNTDMAHFLINVYIIFIYSKQKTDILAIIFWYFVVFCKCECLIMCENK